MEFLTALWLPILLSAVFVFVASSIFHMVLPFHKSDYRKLKNEDAVLNAMRANDVKPGAYMFPCAGSMKEMSSPEMIEKHKTGPVGWMVILPSGGFNLGKSLLGWFVYLVLVGVFVAYISWEAVGADARYLRVFQIAGATALLPYGIGHFHNTIWKGENIGTTMKFLIDGLVYALITAGTFGAFWPNG